MVKIKRTYYKQDYEKEKEVLAIFGFKIIKTKERKTTGTIYAEIDETAPKYYEKMELYNKVGKWNLIPIWPVFVFTIIAIGCLTALLIIYFTDKQNPNLFTYLMALGIPACVLLLSTVVFTYFKFKNDNHNLMIVSTTHEIKDMVDKLEKCEKDERKG